MTKLNDFFNDGFGWKCRHCARETNAAANRHSRFYTEGEGESKQPQLSELALAKWTDPAHTRLTCPRCGITEPVDKA